MSQSQHIDLSRLCIHTITTKPWKIEESAKEFSLAGVKGITVWREALEGRNIRQTRRMLHELDLRVVSLCRGGFFSHKDASKRKAALDNNRRAIAEAEEIGASMLVLVCGADPSQSLNESRKQIRDAIDSLISDASATGVKLAIEPLHPMYADTRSAINTLAQANDIVEELNSPFVGVVVDVYHVWWDPFLEKEIKRSGEKGSLMAFHICDWKLPTTDILFDRGLMGEGCIPIKQIRSWVEAAGFTGFNEVEIFSNAYWSEDQTTYLKKIITAYKEHS
jgi:sugar phosphate isomerase/epimerase